MKIQNLAQVILFPPKIKTYIDFLLEIRRTTNIIPKENQYLFAHPGIAERWEQADIVLKNFAYSCSGIKKPEIITLNKIAKTNSNIAANFKFRQIAGK